MLQHCKKKYLKNTGKIEWLSSSRDPFLLAWCSNIGATLCVSSQPELLRRHWYRYTSSVLHHLHRPVFCTRPLNAFLCASPLWREHRDYQIISSSQRVGRTGHWNKKGLYDRGHSHAMRSQLRVWEKLNSVSTLECLSYCCGEID